MDGQDSKTTLVATRHALFDPAGETDLVTADPYRNVLRCKKTAGWSLLRCCCIHMALLIITDATPLK